MEVCRAMAKTKKNAAAVENGETTNRLEGIAVERETQIIITPPNMKTVEMLLRGTTPLVQNKFSNKAKALMMGIQEAGSQSKKGKKREPKDFEECYQGARHIATKDVHGEPIDEPWDGIHAGGFRHAMVDACSIVGFHMTKGKKTLFVLADGYSEDDAPLVKITKGQPRKRTDPVRNASGVADIRARPMWDIGWECYLRVQYDGDMFSPNDVVNLVNRVGIQCGIAEGRPNSKDSTGCDWGRFVVADVIITDDASLKGQ